MMGSPPHTWRILNTIDIVSLHLRITSTYVENTCKNQINRSIFQDHLHIRGEYLALIYDDLVSEGSPPHTWRIPTWDGPGTVKLGITSTYVENTRSKLSRKSLPRDHLHIRGEYPASKPIISTHMGSPPHTWRIPMPEPAKVDGNRITSTYVENTTIFIFVSYYC